MANIISMFCKTNIYNIMDNNFKNTKAKALGFTWSKRLQEQDVNKRKMKTCTSTFSFWALAMGTCVLNYYNIVEQGNPTFNFTHQKHNGKNIQLNIHMLFNSQTNKYLNELHTLEISRDVK